jgi:AraC family ethanolamine operon transcriptional activator
LARAGLAAKKIAVQIRQTGLANTAAPTGPGVLARSFAECDQFAEAIQHEDVEVVQTVPGRFSSQVLLIPLTDTLIRYGIHENPWLCSGTVLRGRVSVVLDTGNRGATCQHGQRMFEEQALGVYGSGAEHFSRSAPGEYFYVPFCEARFDEAYRAVAGMDSTLRPGEFRRVRPPDLRWQALLGTIAAIRTQAEDAPEAFGDPRVQAAVERSLLSAIVLTVATDRDHPGPGSTRRLAACERSAVVRRAREHLRAHAHTPVYLLDLCRAAGVSERTLRDAFLEHCGMAPMRYPKLRRLHQVRRTLRASGPRSASVKAAALANGFWDLSRFAVEYRRLFGESPSQTLQSTSGSFRSRALLDSPGPPERPGGCGV